MLLTEGAAKLGNLEEHIGLQLQPNIECEGSKFELFLFVYMMLQSPVQQKNVQGLYIFILTTFERNVSVIQVVFLFFYFM